MGRVIFPSGILLARILVQDYLQLDSMFPENRPFLDRN
jgi:hypothetical protein